jgi:hypothetical protein
MADAVMNLLIMVVSFRLLGVVSQLIATATEPELPTIVPQCHRNTMTSFDVCADQEISMHLLQILLPCADNNGQAFHDEDFEKVKQELADRYQGVTAYMRAPAEGVWKNGSASNGERDNVVIFEVMVDRLDLDDWRARRHDLERAFRQETVVIRYMPIELI